MTIWLLAVLLMASLAGVGYRQGAIRVAFSFVGVVLGALLAVPLGNLVKPLLGLVGVKHPLLVYLLPPVIVFIVFSIIFKVAAAAVHHKADVHYKYHAGDLRLALWERLNQRIGMCLGILNAGAYLVLLSFVIYSFSYATVQLASSDQDPRWMRLLNRTGKDLQATGMSKVARALDGRKAWYDAADLAGLIYQNPLLEARLSRYPAFLGISERPDFKDLGNDRQFTELRLGGAPIKEILQHPRVQPIVSNVEMLKMLWGIIRPDMDDLRSYLVSGLSAKYDQEKILGRWYFDVNHAIALRRRAKPNMSSTEAKKIKTWMAENYTGTAFVAMPDRQVLLKDLPQFQQATAQVPPQPPTRQTLQGEWTGGGNSYRVTLSGGVEVGASIDGQRLTLRYEGTDLTFVRED